jgi:hypothetical protein
VGLIAREIEARGIPTICMSSAYSITASVNPPRAVYLDFPLGHTAGKSNDKPLQRKIMIDTLSALDSIQAPGTIRKLGYQWSDDDTWKDFAMRAKPGGSQSDNRIERFPNPQYQLPEDELAARRSLETDGCPSCVWLSD